MGTIRIGVVGTSEWTQAAYLGPLTDYPLCSVVGLAGRDQQRAEALAAKHRTRRFDTWESLIAEGQLDGIVISTPNDLHGPIASAAMNRGIHVFVEKPIALDVPQAEALVALAETQRLVGMVMLTYRWMPEFIELRRLVAEGAVGRPMHIDVAGLSGYSREHAYDWRFDPRRGGAGVLSDMGPHVFDLIYCLGGPAAAIVASTSRWFDRGALAGEGDAASALVKLRSGASASVRMSVVDVTGPRDREMMLVRVSGSEGTAYLPFEWGQRASITLARDGQTEQVLPLPGGTGRQEPAITAESVFRLLLRNGSAGSCAFVDAVLGRGVATPSLRDGLRAQRMIGAAQQSADEGRWISVDDD